MYTTVWRFYACRTPEWPSIFSCLMSRMYDAKYDDSSKIRRQLDIFMYKNLCIQTCVFNINIKYEHKITNITNKLIFTDIWYPITNIINIKYFLYIFFFQSNDIKACTHFTNVVPCVLGAVVITVSVVSSLADKWLFVSERWWLFVLLYRLACIGGTLSCFGRWLGSCSPQSFGLAMLRKHSIRKFQSWRKRFVYPQGENMSAYIHSQ